MSRRGNALTVLLGSAVLGSAALGWYTHVKHGNEELKDRISTLAAHDRAMRERVTHLAAEERRRGELQAVAARNVRNLRSHLMRFRRESARLTAEKEENELRMESREKEFAAQRRRLEEVDDELTALRRESEIAKKEGGVRMRAALDTEGTVRELTEKLDYYEKRDEQYRRATREYEAVVADARRALSALAAAEARGETLRTENAVAHYNLGVLYAREGRHADAARELELALSLDPSDAAAHYNLALIQDVYLNEPDAAMEHYQAYLRLLPSAADAKKVEYRLFQMRLQKKVESVKR